MDNLDFIIFTTVISASFIILIISTLMEFSKAEKSNNR